MNRGGGSGGIDVKDGENMERGNIFAAIKATSLVLYCGHAENFQRRKAHRARIRARNAVILKYELS